MDTKLTLKLDKKVIGKAKAYALQHNISLSRLIESYLKSITGSRAAGADPEEISPFVKSISSGKGIPANLDYKEEYAGHLAKKHQ